MTMILLSISHPLVELCQNWPVFAWFAGSHSRNKPDSIVSIVPLGLIHGLLVAVFQQFLARFFSFCAAMFHAILLRALLLLGARLGFTELVEIDRLSQA